MQQRTVDSDITVVGGGLAGVCAAISAARLGKTVALVTNRPVLGGNSSSEIRVWVVGATAHGVQRFARETGVIGELYVENQYRNPEGNPIHWDEVVLDAVRAEENIRLFLNTDVRHVDADDTDDERVVTAVHGWTMGSEIDTTFSSPYFLDCTGDGLVGHLAGAEYRLGREARDEFDEPWAPEVADGEFLGSTILFHTKDTGKPIRFIPPESTKDITTTPIPESRVIRSGDTGTHYWWIEWGGQLDIVHDNERIRDELKSVIFGIWDYIKNSGKFDAETLDLEWVGALPGKREYRRFLGDHVLTQNDIVAQRHFDDQAAFGGWSIDLHPVEGMYATSSGALQRYSDGIYGIPFRSYYSRNVANLLMAGRDISATHVAFGSSRVMATCGAGGEAAGTGAALAIDLGVRPRELAGAHVETLQQTLLRQDASVFGVVNRDPDDLARRARVTASSTLTSIDPADVRAGAESEGPVGPRGEGPQAARQRRLGEPWGDLRRDAPTDTAATLLRSASEPAAGPSAERAALARIGGQIDLDDDPYPLDRDVALLVPVDPALDSVDVLLTADADTELGVSLYTTGKPQNFIPVDRRDGVRVPVSAGGPQWVSLPLTWRPDTPENVVLVFAANPHVNLCIRDTQVPGVLTLPRKPAADGDQNVAVDEEKPLIQWPARPLRGRTLRARLNPPTAAFAAEKAVGGYQRPYGGPQLWVSAATDFAQPEWLRLDWDEPVEIGLVRLVFDDDVDVELNTLHHHRTPDVVFPELARDYRLEALVDGQWREVASVAENRKRQRVHTIEPVRADALRVFVTASNGAPQARIVSVRAYPPQASSPASSDRPET